MADPPPISCHFVTMRPVLAGGHGRLPLRDGRYVMMDEGSSSSA